MNLEQDSGGVDEDEKERIKCYHGDYIKMNQIQVSHDSKNYAIAY